MFQKDLWAYNSPNVGEIQKYTPGPLVPAVDPKRVARGLDYARVWKQIRKHIPRTDQGLRYTQKCCVGVGVCGKSVITPEKKFLELQGPEDATYTYACTCFYTHTYSYTYAYT